MSSFCAAVIERHVEVTGSPRAEWILENCADMLPKFVKVFPHEYKRVLGVPRAQRHYIPPPPPEAATVEQVLHG